MKNGLLFPDYLVFFIYFIVVASYGYWIYRKKKKAQTDTHDFFLAEGSLTWWAIGASLIASNISAEQFIGMSGDGFFAGVAVAAYEWLAALALIIIAVWFMPVYLKNKIYTMPQFLKTRYNESVSLIMAVFWLFLYVFVNLTSILYLGALAINGLLGGEYLHAIMIVLSVFAIIITLGGMKVIGYTDVIQVSVLIIGGLATTILALNIVSDKIGMGAGAIDGFKTLLKDAPDHFHMIFKKPTPDSPQIEIDKYLILPGIAMYFAGQWIVNLNYWGCNQYITQRALGADLKTARGGILFAAFLKLLMPIIVVIPGIAAFVLYKNGYFQQEMLANGELVQDKAYPVLLNLLPSGLKGLAFAALTAAVVASLAGKANSISTIFTLDIYKKKISPEASEKKLVWTGRVAVIVSMLIAVLIAPFMGIDKKGGFEYIQEYTGFVSPGILAMFLLGFFWKKTTSNAALFATVGGFALSLLFKVLPTFANLEWLSGFGFSKLVKQKDGSMLYEIPFMDRMGFVFVICVIGMYIISVIENRRGIVPNGLEVDKKMFRTNPGFAVGALLVVGILAALYTMFW